MSERRSIITGIFGITKLNEFVENMSCCQEIDLSSFSVLQRDVFCEQEVSVGIRAKTFKGKGELSRNKHYALI
jgi:hypothetical protein